MSPVIADPGEIRWDEETDGVVLGCGGAGAVAAITARDAGAQVVIGEKGEGGGNTKLATNAFVCPTDNAAVQAAVSPDPMSEASLVVRGAVVRFDYVLLTARNPTGPQ